MEPSAKGEPRAEPSDDIDAGDEEDQEECGWCRWMKAGGCKSEFQVWLDCVDAVKAAGRDDVETCAAVMGPLWECMERNKDYYAPQLDSLADRKVGPAEDDGDGKDGEGNAADKGHQREGQEGGKEGSGQGPAAATVEPGRAAVAVK